MDLALISRPRTLLLASSEPQSFVSKRGFLINNDLEYDFGSEWIKKNGTGLLWLRCWFAADLTRSFFVGKDVINHGVRL